MSYIEYATDESVAVITLNRPEKRNAQSEPFLHDLDAAWSRAAEDDDVRVIVVRANGKDFSAGHDLGVPFEERRPWKPGRGIYDHYIWEQEHYLGYSRRWRDIPKPSIAAVQGNCLAAGLMLAWPCDLIIAAENARFGDNVARMGIGAGVEYHGHTWELGPRKAKELLFTAGFVDAAEAHRLGMVNRVVPNEQLDNETMQLAHQIATMDPFALAMAKRAVNLTQDAMGRDVALKACFDMHWLGHAHVYAVNGAVGTRLVEIDDLAKANKDKS
jgi:enoyl-CoA hydratase